MHAEYSIYSYVIIGAQSPRSLSDSAFITEDTEYTIEAHIAGQREAARQCRRRSSNKFCGAARSSLISVLFMAAISDSDCSSSSGLQSCCCCRTGADLPANQAIQHCARCNISSHLCSFIYSTATAQHTCTCSVRVVLVTA